MQKTNWFVKSRKAIQNILILVVAILALVAAILFIENEKINTIESDFYQYFVGIRCDFEAGDTLELTEDNTTIVHTDGGDSDTDTTPLYYTYEDRIITTVPMSYVNPVMDTEEYIPANSEIVRESDHTYYICEDGSKIELTLGVLYDGSNTYVFLDNTTVTWYETPMELSYFSFAKVTSTGAVTLYNYLEDTIFEGEANPYDVTATDEYGSYKISLVYDTMEGSYGTERILYFQPEKLELIE